MSSEVVTENQPQAAAIVSLAVRQLAEYVHRRGDIHVRFERSTTGAEGIATQKRVQAPYIKTESDIDEGYVAELSVSHEFAVADERWRLGGRIDGCAMHRGLIEEYKTTRADIDQMHAHNGHVHRAQLMLYGGILAHEYPQRSQWQLDLCYCHPDRDKVVRRISETITSTVLIEFLDASIAQWRERLLRLYAYRVERDTRLADLPFPFKSFRPNQRALAGRVYQALTGHHNLLLEAATGTGKSLATLFPAYRALSTKGLNRVFFLTGRTTGQDAAQQAAKLLQQEAQLRTVTIIAREKACLVPGMPCDPEGCEYARGYYDKLPAALADGLAQGHTTPAAIKELAQTHTVCPFELSLDLALWADLVVMDYNYLFDPVVRLQRFSEQSDAMVLIDEAHQLEPRVRDMLSVVFPKRQLSAVLAREADTPEPIRKLAATLRRSFTRAAKQYVAPISDQPSAFVGGNRLEGNAQIWPPKAFTERVAELVKNITELSAEVGAESGADSALSEPLKDLFFTALRWQRAQEWLTLANKQQEGSNAVPNAAAFYSADTTELQLRCIDAAGYIATTLENYGPNAQFSGTLSPLTLYQRLHGDSEAELARVAAGDLSERLGVFVVPDIPTYFRSRSASLPRLLELVHTVASARPGNYFVAFPSFAYLAQFSQAYAEKFPGQTMQVQQPGSTPADREAFVQHFRAAATPTLGCVVLGGVFTESLDFANEALLGVIVVSVALPPPDSAREVLAQHYAQAQDPQFGQTVAYRQPAMVRVVQAAGRVVRNETDRGIVCLVDARFQQPEFTRLQPAHWRPQLTQSDRIATALDTFWRHGH